MSRFRMFLDPTTRRNFTIATLGGFGADLLCQCVIEDKPFQDIDRQRLFAMTVFSGAYIGIFTEKVYAVFPKIAHHLWLRLGSNARKAVGLPHGYTPGSKFEGGVAWLADNTIHVPLIYTPTYFMAVGVMKGDGASVAAQTCRREWWPALTSCWWFWGPLMAANFTVVPVPLRVQVVGAANFIWTVLFDYMTNGEGHHHSSPSSSEHTEPLVSSPSAAADLSSPTSSFTSNAPRVTSSAAVTAAAVAAVAYHHSSTPTSTTTTTDVDASENQQLEQQQQQQQQQGGHLWSAWRLLGEHPGTRGDIAAVFEELVASE